jgi:hypothetical protein
MSGWCFGNLFGLGRRERSLCILAASLYDLDGLGIIFGPVAFWKYHHLLGHNLMVGLLVSAVLTYFSKQRPRAFIAYLSLFHIHILMDYFGSGEEWAITYFWPISNWSVQFPYAWPFYSWQNIGTAFCFILWTLAIIIFKKRTPLELVMPSLDSKIVKLAQKLKLKAQKDKAQ